MAVLDNKMGMVLVGILVDISSQDNKEGKVLESRHQDKRCLDNNLGTELLGSQKDTSLQGSM